MAPLRFTAAGNYLRIVSRPAWHHCVSMHQKALRPEISRLRFAPLEMTERHGTIAFHIGRKLLAPSFLSGMTLWRLIPIGNCSQIVSYPADAIVFHTDRKPFANSFLPDLARLRLIPAGNLSQIVSYPTWHYGVSYRQETVRR